MDLSSGTLDAYFTRINYSGPREPTLAVLRTLQYRHVLTFPFENLDVLLGRPIALNAEALADKLIGGLRGGYCFEQNGLFRRVLTSLGFAVTPLAARVRLWIPDEIQTGRAHLLLKVDLPEGPYIVDVGFGGTNPTGPFALVHDVEQPTSLETCRIVARGRGPRTSGTARRHVDAVIPLHSGADGDAGPGNRELVRVDRAHVLVRPKPGHGTPYPGTAVDAAERPVHAPVARWAGRGAGACRRR